MNEDLPRRFQLVRIVDVSGVSGTGVVADGIEWPDGTVVIRWRGSVPSTACWASTKAAMTVHGHNGATVLEWID